MPSAAAAEASKAFLDAVNFALTGSDGNALRLVDKDRCIFSLDSPEHSNIFYLNNIQLDRLTFKEEAKQQQYGLDRRVVRLLIVTLRSDQIVHESVESAYDPTQSDDQNVQELLSDARTHNPTLYAKIAKPIPERHFTQSDWDLELPDNESARVIRAWRYIYSHGCTGQKSRL